MPHMFTTGLFGRLSSKVFPLPALGGAFRRNARARRPRRWMNG